MSAYTPGPWHVGGVGVFGGNRVWSATNQPIAMLVSFGKSPPDLDSTAQANGRLIAAAPELYEALMSSVTFIAKAGELSLLDADECAPLLAVYNAVLAKVAP